MVGSTESGFHIAPFAVDGEPVGAAFWPSSSLSANWIGFCAELLQRRGSAFDLTLGGNLSHIRLRFASSSGAAIATLLVNGAVGASLLLQTGQTPDADREVAEMFVESLRRTQMIVAAAATAEPFAAVFAITKRPLLVLVAFPQVSISDQDHDVIRELGVHLAGAYFSGENP